MANVRAAVEHAGPNTVDTPYDICSAIPEGTYTTDTLVKALEYTLYTVHLTYLRISHVGGFTSGY